MTVNSSGSVLPDKVALFVDEVDDFGWRAVRCYGAASCEEIVDDVVVRLSVVA